MLDLNQGDRQDALDERIAQLAYCREHLLPIWERQTGGNPVARQLLECASVESEQARERFQQLVATTRKLRKRARSARIAAALAAARVIGHVYNGVPHQQFIQMCQWASEAESLANRVAEFWPN
jgi:hypothetical protein